MKTLKNISTFLVIALSFGTVAYADGPESHKLYEITDNGDFHYNYQMPDVNEKKGVKPVTVRTFYLETVRKGLIPATVSYNDFVAMTTEEKKALLAEQQLMATRKVEASGEMLNPMAPTPISAAEVTPAVNTNGNAQQVELMGQTSNLPWIVQVVVEPYNGYVIPEGADVEKALSGLK